MKYVALLRGINVGGNKRIEMERLKEMMESLGFTDVVTILNSGNVVFASSETSDEALRNIIEEGIMKMFGFAVQTIIRSETDIKRLLKSDPFKGILVTKETRLYVTFLNHPVLHSLSLPYRSPDGLLQVLAVTDSEIISVVTVNEKFNTTDAMKEFDKKFGKDVTMRNWNTIEKIAAKF